MRETIGRICRTLLPLLLACFVAGQLAAQESKPKSNDVKESSQESKQQEKGTDKSKPEKPLPPDSKETAPDDKTDDKQKQEIKEKPPTRVSNVDRTHILNDITFDDLKFEMKKGEDFRRTLLSKKIEGYHGTTVRIRGYIQPGTKQSGLTRFIFVRDNQECCFGAQAAIYDNILVKLNPQKSANFTVRPITIEGKFALKEYIGPNRKVWSLYRMYDAEVK